MLQLYKPLPKRQGLSLSISPDNYRAELRDLGLNDREARVYLAMLSNGQASASQLAVSTRIPQNKIYTPLEGLLEAGLCQRIRSGRQSLYSAVDPAVALAGPLGDLANRLDKAQSFSKDLGEVFANKRPSLSSLGDVEVLSNRDAIRQRYLQLLDNTNHEIAGFARGPYAFESREDLATQFDMGQQLKERCTARWVYELKAERDPLLVEFLRDYECKGDVRVCDHLPLKIVIFDGETIIFTDDNPDDVSDLEQMRVAIMRHPAVVSAFMSLFEFFWQESLAISDWFKTQK